MGGLFKSPSPPAPEPVEIKDTSGEDERKRRLEDLDRRRRGRQGMITTSQRGLFETKDWVPQRKSLLGE